MSTRKRFYEDPPAPSNSNTKKTRRNESVPAIHLTPKSTATTLEQRKKKVETEWRKAVQKQHTERETNTNSELEQVRDETHPEVVTMMKQLKEERDKKLRLLHQWRENQIQSIEDSAHAERKECEEAYERNISGIRAQYVSLCSIEQQKVDAEKLQKRMKIKGAMLRDVRLRRLRKMARKPMANSAGYYEEGSIVLQVKGAGKLSLQEIQADMAKFRQALEALEPTSPVVTSGDIEHEHVETIEPENVNVSDGMA